MDLCDLGVRMDCLSFCVLVFVVVLINGSRAVD